MKWLRFAHQGRTGFGVVDQDRIAVHQGEMFGSAQATGEQLALAEVQVLAPCEPRQCFALWNNFRAAAAKNNWAEPTEPLYFLKGANSYSHHLAPVPKPRHYDGRIIFEAELAVVIGKGGRDIAPEHAAAHVFGYTCVNDVTALEMLHDVPVDGVDENDPVFVLGYPGRTFRHRPASYLAFENDVRMPYIADLYDWEIATMEATSFNFMAEKSMVPIQLGRSGWPSTSIFETKFS